VSSDSVRTGHPDDVSSEFEEQILVLFFEFARCPTGWPALRRAMTVVGGIIAAAAWSSDKEDRPWFKKDRRVFYAGAVIGEGFVEPLNPWFGKAAILGIIAAIVVIRAPFGIQSRKIPIVANHRGARETFALAIVWLGSLILPLLWVLFPLFAAAEYPLNPAVFFAGVLAAASGLWLLWQSHIELGRNWSISLELREGHELVTSGLYRHVRHPMYTSIFLYALGQALVVPNWIVGPANLVAFFVLFAMRVQSEEQMMADKFGDQYRNYMAKTKRLIPHIW
jgi:protein-S-isoprenylcysteine O-methyltransferase Ste14